MSAATKLVPSHLDQSPVPDPGAVMLGEWLDIWFTSWKSGVRASTAASRAGMAEVAAVVSARSRSLSSLDEQAIRDLIARVDGDGYRRRDVYLLLKRVLDDAVEAGHIEKNPMRRIPRPRATPQERPHWDQAQARTFLDTCLAEDALLRAPLFALLLTTGLRISEALGLERRDVDFDRRTLTVRRALVWHCNHWSLGEPKSRSSRRTIGLGEAAIEALRRLELPIQTDRGNPPQPCALHISLKRCCKRADVPFINVHGLRHVHAALALAATKDFHAVSRRLGHSDVTITMKIYAYTLQDDEEVAQAVDRMLDANPAQPSTIAQPSQPQPQQRSTYDRAARRLPTDDNGELYG